ncbi:zinc finger protein 593 homolog [Symsagittifera roscoffensis]|uniref:zinc finger protein 593 homolog n=1 Tax=Symsagittifera roscoffensis TaxID=84072 RepID=UPI00307BEFD0
MKKARFKTKNRKRDYDQIADDTKPEKAEKLLNQEPDIELPGEAQFYCVPCARHFIDDKSLSCHQKSKNHKKQIAKILDNNAFDHKESLAAAGFGSYQAPAPKFRKIDIDVRKESLQMTE